MKQHGEFPEPARVEPAIFTQNLTDEENPVLSWWQIRYLSIAFAWTHWSKQVSLFRMSSSYSGWPIRNKQFHLLAVATSTLSATVSDRSQSKSPTCQELSAIIQYQICIVEQKKTTTTQIGRNSFFIPPKSLPIITSSTASSQRKSDKI